MPHLISSSNYNLEMQFVEEITFPYERIKSLRFGAYKTENYIPHEDVITSHILDNYK